MRHAHRVEVLLVVAALAVTPAAAMAQAASPTTAAASDAAKQAEALFKEGVALVGQQRWVEAERKFLEAYAARPTYDIAANLGHTQVRLKKSREAATHLEIAVRQWPLTGKAEAKQLAEKKLAELRKELTVSRITVSVAGAEVVVDGRKVGVSPIEHEVFLDPGVKATVEARLAGHETAREVVEGKKGEELRVELAMRVSGGQGAGAAAGAAAGAGTGAGAGAGTETGAETGTGPHAQGAGRDHAMSAVDGSGAPDRRVRTAILIGGGAAAGAALVTGVVMTVIANGKASDAEQQRDSLVAAHGAGACTGSAPVAGCADLDSAYDARDALSNGAFWSFVGAGVVSAGTLIYALTTSRSSAPASAMRIRVVPVTGPGVGGVLVRGEF